MRVRRYHFPGSAYLPGRGPRVDGVALAIAGNGGIWRDPGATEPFEGVIWPQDDGHYPPIYLDGDARYTVTAVTAAGVEVMTQGVGPLNDEAAIPDDAGLFVHLDMLAVPDSTSTLRTEGWSKAGLGAGDYVSDDLATAALAAACPRFCTRTANGRYFRLRDAAGLIVVEQGGALGDPAGTGHVDDRAAIQGAIDYAARLKLDRVGFAQTRYAVWMDERHSPISGAGLHAADGHGLVLRGGQRLTLVGLTGDRPRLAFRACGGGDFDGERAGEAYHLVDGRVWRGAGVFIPASTPRAVLRLEHLALDGGTRKSGSFIWPADPRNGNGWDTSHKGIWVEPSPRRGGSVEIVGCELTGWRGETVYAANDPDAWLLVRDSTFSHSNGQGLNPNSCRVDIEGARISACYIGIEGWTGASGGRIVATEIVDCYGVLGKSGGAFSLQGGVHGASARSAYNAPRQATAGNPTGTIDITCRNCGPALVGWWLSGKLTLVDTKLVLGAEKAFGEGSQHIDLDVSLVTDRTRDTFVAITGGKGKAGDRLTDHVVLRIASSATAAAQAAGLRPEAPLVWHGSLGSDIHVQIRGRAGRAEPHANAPSPDFHPRIN